MAIKAKTPIQLRFDDAGGSILRIRLVERQEDDSFKTLESREVDLAKHPEEIQRRYMVHGAGDIYSKRVSQIKDGREKYDTILDHLVPQFEEGRWSDGRGASPEIRAIATILRIQIKDAKEKAQKEPEKFAAALNHPMVIEEIKRIKAAESGGSIDLDDLIGEVDE